MPNIREELEIEIDEAGQVKIHVHGISGKSCAKIAQNVANSIGKVINQSYTSDYYKPGPDVSISDTSRTKII